MRIRKLIILSIHFSKRGMSSKNALSSECYLIIVRNTEIPVGVHHCQG